VGALTVLNAAPAPTHPLDFLDAVDLLIVNESEARSLDPQGTDEPRALAAALRALGPGAVVVTLGANGCAHADAGGAGVTAARAVQALDTTGAGDCFSAALAVRLAEGADLAGAVEFATGAAALAVQRLGAQAAMPSREAVDRSVRLSGSSGRTGSLQ
jgi:ribokinase